MKNLFIPAFIALLLFSRKSQALSYSEFWSRPDVINGLKYKPFFEHTEKKFGIPQDILAKMGWQESRFRDDIVTGKVLGKSNESGIMQITPRWHPGVQYFDPQSAIDYAGKYLKENYDKFKDWKLAVMAYNWGPGNVQKWISPGPIGFDRDPSVVPAVTKNYVTAVFGRF